jgi:hypothetical protein
MRTTLALVLGVLAWGMAGNAQPQASAQSTTPPATSGYRGNPPAKRFFFTADPRTLGQPAIKSSGALRPDAPADQAPQSRVYPTLRFPLTGLLPLASQPSQDFRRFLKPKNTRLFFFTKP